jgi:hypothetical protein
VSNHWHRAGLLWREARGTAVNHLLDRSFRHDKGLVDRMVTRLVLTQIPDTTSDHVAASARRRGLLDSPTKRRERPSANK